MKLTQAILTLLSLPLVALANDHGHGHVNHAEPAHHAEPAAHAEAESKPGHVAAVDAKTAQPLRANELIQSHGAVLRFVDKSNTRIELAPHSVGEFRDESGFHLLRGSASFENKTETTVRTTSATLNFVGRVVLSYDYKEKSTSAFVLEGQGRMRNAHDDSQSLRLDRFRGATMLVGDVIPQLTRQLDIGSLENWLKGYAWPEQTRQAWISLVPNGALAVKSDVPAHLEEAKLENYFSAIDNDDEVQAPDYYDRKYADPDQVIAEANSVKEKGRELKPEEAALVALPNHKIDLGFELVPQVITLQEKQQETFAGTEHGGGRSLASVKPVAVKRKVSYAGPTVVSEHRDPEVAGVLQRLRQLQGQEAVVSPQIEFKSKPKNSRAPASVSDGPVPDAVYDYSQNF